MPVQCLGRRQLLGALGALGEDVTGAQIFGSDLGRLELLEALVELLAQRGARQSDRELRRERDLSLPVEAMHAQRAARISVLGEPFDQKLLEGLELRLGAAQLACDGGELSLYGLSFRRLWLRRELPV